MPHMPLRTVHVLVTINSSCNTKFRQIRVGFRAFVLRHKNTKIKKMPHKRRVKWHI